MKPNPKRPLIGWAVLLVFPLLVAGSALWSIESGYAVAPTLLSSAFVAGLIFLAAALERRSFAADSAVGHKVHSAAYVMGGLAVCLGLCVQFLGFIPGKRGHHVELNEAYAAIFFWVAAYLILYPALYRFLSRRAGYSEPRYQDIRD